MIWFVVGCILGAFVGIVVVGYALAAIVQAAITEGFKW